MPHDNGLIDLRRPARPGRPLDRRRCRGRARCRTRWSCRCRSTSDRKPVELVGRVRLAPGGPVLRIVLGRVHVVGHPAGAARGQDIEPFVPGPRPAVEALDEPPDRPRHRGEPYRRCQRAGGSRQGLGRLADRDSTPRPAPCPSRTRRHSSRRTGCRSPRNGWWPTPKRPWPRRPTMGFPVVVKLSGDGIAHKTERGLVRLGLTDARAVRAAADELLAAATPDDGDVALLVAPMLRGNRELIAGLSRGSAVRHDGDGGRRRHPRRGGGRRVGPPRPHHGGRCGRDDR